MLSFALVTAASSARWAVIMAGSKGFRNYRHQADAYQMYQILTSRGFEKDKIILMSYDDVADDSSNPKKGKIFNIKKHINVRPPINEIKYRAENVTADNLFAVLTGDKSATGPVLQSTENDDVFFYYNDHGSQGFLCIPSGNGKHITAPEFREAVDIMAKKKMFKRFFIAIEACYSGSVGKAFKDMDNVVVVTAANAVQSSYSHGYDRSISSFRTNEWTNHLLRFILHHPQSTVGRLYNYTKMLTYGSDARMYGDKKLFDTPLSTFLGEAEPIDLNFENAEVYQDNATVKSMDTERIYLKERIADKQATKGSRRIFKEALAHEDSRRALSKRIMKRIAAISGKNARDLSKRIPKDTEWKCYAHTVEAFRTHCGEFGEFELERLPLFAQLCDERSEDEIVQHIKDVCPVVQWHLDM